jgi:hypothetical protein
MDQQLHINSCRRVGRREQTFIDTANGLFSHWGHSDPSSVTLSSTRSGTSVAAALAPSEDNYSADAPIYDHCYRNGIRTFDYHPSYPDPWRVTAFCHRPARLVGAEAEAQGCTGRVA